MSIVEFTRWFLALFFIGVGMFYAVRIIGKTSRMQVSPVFVGRPGTLHYATHTTFRVFRVLILSVCILRLLWPDFDRFLVPIHALWHPAILMSGNLFLVTGISAILAIHFYMGEDWRSGTRGADRSRLIVSGPFAFSRNPAMMGVIAGQLGFFLALPTLFALLCLIVGVSAVVIQVRVEEKLLHERFGAEYDRYVAHTPRWLFFD